MIKIEVCLKGIPPTTATAKDGGLLMHSDKAMLAGIRIKPPKGLPTKTDAEKVAYRSENGNLFIPTTAIFGTMFNGAKGWLTKGSKLGVYLPSLDILPPEEIPLLDLKGKPIKDYDLNVRIVHNWKVGRLVAGCPWVKEWTAKFEMRYNPLIFLDTHETLHTCLEKAGFYVGLCCYRPEHKGKFGRFTIENWKVSEF